MANNTSDGSLIFDTELDNTGFEKGTEKLLHAIGNLTGEVNNIGTKMQQAFNDITPMIYQIATASTGMYRSMASAGEAVSNANREMSATGQNAAETLGKQNRATQQANAAMEQQAQAITVAGSSANVAKTNLSGLEKEINSVAMGMQSVSKSAEAGFSNGKAVLAFEAKLDAMESKLAAAKQKLADFGKQKIYSEDFQWYLTAIKEAEEEIAKLKEQYSSIGHNPDTVYQEWSRVDAAIESAEKQLGIYKAEMTEMKNDGSAYTTMDTTAEYARMQQGVTAVGQQLAKNRSLIDSESIAQARLNVQEAQEQVTLAQTDGERQIALARLQQMQAELQNVANASANSGKESESAFVQFGKVLKSAAISAVSLGKKLAKVSFKAITAGAKKAGTALKGYISKSRETSLTANALAKSLFSLKRMLVTRVKRMFISQIFNGMKNAVNTLTQFSSAFNQSMSNIKNSATQLSGNLAVTMGNLISAIEPVLTTIINAISKAVSYLNAFFAMLGGKSTMTVAKKQTASYADSLSDASASADKAADSQKELNNQVYGFDELNKRNKDSDTSKDVGGSGAGGADLFEEVPVDSYLPDSVKNFFESIKAAFAAGDYEGVGKTIASGLNTGMKIVDDWINNTFRPLGVKWAGIVARILNGLVDGFDWGLMGKTVADGINSVFDILNTFLTNFDFISLGVGIGKGINGLFSNVQWDLLGQTFANKWNALIHTIYGIVSTADWPEIGNAIATFVNNFFTTIDYTKAAQAFVNGFNGIFAALRSFTVSVNWNDIATNIYTGLNTAIQGIDWAAAGQALSGFAIKLLGTFAEVAKKTDWQGLGRGIGEFLSNIDGATIIGDVGTIIWEAFSGVLSGLFDTSGGKVVLGVGAGLLAIKGLFGLGKFALTSPITAWVLSASGAFSGLATAASGLVSGLGSILGAIGSVIFSPTGLIIAGIVAGVALIVTHWDDIKAAASSVAEWVGEKWTALKETCGKIWGGITSTLSSAWDGIKSTAATVWGGIKDTVTGAFDKAKEKLSTTAEKIGSGLSSAWESAKSTASSAWEGIKSTVTGAFDSAKTTLSSTAEKIGSGLSSAWKNVKSTASTAWSNVKSTVTSAFDNTKSTVTSTAGNLGSGLSTAWANVKSGGASAWNALKSTLTSTFSSTKAAIDSTSSNLKSSLSSAWNSMKSTASSVWSNIKSSLQSTMSGIKSNTDSSTSGMSSTISSRFSNMKSTMVSNMQNAASSIKNQSWYSIGSNICSGISSGINSGWSWLSNTVGNLASNLLSRAKSALGIHSPSRLFRDEIGENIGLGLAEGIEGTTATVLDTVSNLANATANGFDTKMPTLETAESSTVSGLDAVADRLAGIADTFRSITSMLEAIGGLQMPQIGAGTVVPYKTKVDTSETENKAYEAISDLTGGLDERMADMSYVLKQILAIVKSLNLNIDIDALADAITQQQRSKIRNFGGA